MNKVLAAMIAGLFAAGAYAQGGSQSSEAAPQTNTKSQQRAEQRKDSRPAGQVKAPGGDQSKVSEGSGGVTASKALDTGEARKLTRDTRRYDKKTGGKKAVPSQGKTPE